MPYIKKVTKAGNLVLIEKINSARFGKKGKHSLKENITTGEQLIINENICEKKLWLLLVANFKPKDLHLVLTYKKSSRPTIEESKKHISDFIKKARTIFKKNGLIFKYIWVCEYEGAAIHFHIIIPAIDVAKLVDIWKWGAIRPTLLYEDGHFKALARYLVKETEKGYKMGAVYGKRYYPSRNLIRPESVSCLIASNNWLKKPNIPHGYELIGEVINGEYVLSKAPYQVYLIKKLE